MAVVADIILAGTAAARPAAASSNNGYIYLATDTAGGTSYRSNGTTWVAMGLGVTGGFTSPLTTTGDIIYSSSGSTAARLGIGGTGQFLLVVGGVPAWGGPPRCKAYNNTTQSVTDSTVTAVALNAEEIDTNTFHDTVTNNSRITIPAGMGGDYLIFGKTNFAASTANGANYLWVRKNGTTAIVGSQGDIQTSAVRDNAPVVCVMASLIATDYIEMMCYQDSGGAVNIGSASAEKQSVLQVIKMS